MSVAESTAADPLLDVRGLCKSLPVADGSLLEIVRDVSLSLRPGGFVSVSRTPARPSAPRTHPPADPTTKR